jgi:hypothetical protein
VLSGLFVEETLVRVREVCGEQLRVITALGGMYLNYPNHLVYPSTQKVSVHAWSKHVG